MRNKGSKNNLVYVNLFDFLVNFDSVVIGVDIVVFEGRQVFPFDPFRESNLLLLLHAKIILLNENLI